MADVVMLLRFLPNLHNLRLACNRIIPDAIPQCLTLIQSMESITALGRLVPNVQQTSVAGFPIPCQREHVRDLDETFFLFRFVPLVSSTLKTKSRRAWMTTRFRRLG